MYTRRKRASKRDSDDLVSSICYDFLRYNSDIFFIIKKTYIEEKGRFYERKGAMQVFCSVPLEELIVPPNLKLNPDGSITAWCDDKVLMYLKYQQVTFYDGEINGRKKERMYLDFVPEENVLKIIKTSHK